MQVVVTDVVRDEGSIVLMQGLTTDGSDRVITFACDHRPAQEIVAALEQAEDALCWVEDWQVVRIQPMPRLEDVAGCTASQGVRRCCYRDGHDLSTHPHRFVLPDDEAGA